MTLPTMSFIFGALLLAVGILGGGFEVKEVKVSNVTSTARILAAVFGVVFIGLGFVQPDLSKSLEPARPAPVAAVATVVTMSDIEHAETDGAATTRRSMSGPIASKIARTPARQPSNAARRLMSGPACKERARSVG